MCEAIETLKRFRYGTQTVDPILFNKLIQNLSHEKTFTVENFQQHLPPECPAWRTLTLINFSFTHQCRIGCVDVEITIKDHNGELFDDDDERVDYHTTGLRSLIADKLSSVMDHADDYDDDLVLEMLSDELIAELKKHNVKLEFEGCDTGSDS